MAEKETELEGQRLAIEAQDADMQKLMKSEQELKKQLELRQQRQPGIPSNLNPFELPETSAEPAPSTPMQVTTTTMSGRLPVF